MRLDNKYIGKNFFCINTDAEGISTQHLQYLPYGELFVEQRDNSNYFTPYKFSAKEKDEETSYSYFGARYLASDFSFWLSVDPMADKYPNISPYAYCAWNPVMLVDPDGRDLVITGEASDKAVNQLQNKTNLKLTRNAETGKLSYEGEAKTRADKRLAKIIDDKKITTNIIAKNTNQVNENAQTNEYGGAYMGNEVKKDENGNITSVYANQFVNPDVIGYWDKKTESEIGTGMLHEVVEAYAGGEIALKTGVSSPDSRYIKTTTYDLAHKIANKIAPGDIIKEVHRYSNPVSFNLSKDIFGRMLFQPVYEKIKFRRAGN